MSNIDENKTDENFAEPWEYFVNRKKYTAPTDEGNIITGKTETIADKSCRNGKTPVKKKKRGKVTKSFFCGSLATLLIIGGCKIGAEISGRISYFGDLHGAKEIVTKEAKEKLIKEGLAITAADDEFVVLENSASDYQSLELDSPEEVYPYFLVLPTSEFGKLITATTYEDGKYYYTGTEQFLTVNGYFNPETGEPSTAVYEDYMNAELVSAFRNEDMIAFEANSESEGRRR